MSSYIGVPGRDNTTLFNGTVTTAGPGSTLDLTGFDTALIQVTGIFSGIITFERSLDNVNWFIALVTELNALNQKTQIESTGIFSVRGEAQYLRYNITNITGSVNLLIDGNQNAINAGDKLSWAMDETNNSPLNIRLQAQNSGVKQDNAGAFILSDAPTAVQVNLTATQNSITIDTQGYQTISITTGAGIIAAVSGSNDSLTFQPNIGYSLLSGLSTSALAASGNFIFPCLTRYIRVIASAGGQFTYYLRNQPYTNPSVNLQQVNGVTISQATAQFGMNIVSVGGTATVTGGLAGTLGVGGSTAVGVAPTSNPIIAGGIDPGGLGRRLAADALGTLFVSSRVVPSSTAALGTSTQAPVPVATAGYDNRVALSVQDTMQFEGQNHVELLGQILQEMKIMNQQLYELPRFMAAQMNGYQFATSLPQPVLGDEPTAMRNDASLFINQQ
jgi:hypothetical protein